MHIDDYRYSDEAQERDLKIVWRCNHCQTEREYPPGTNVGGECECGGVFLEAGETYLA